MKRTVVILLVVAGLAALGGEAWWLATRQQTNSRLVVYGNIDLRQVELAFNNSQRISEVLVEEGDRVKRGQLVARLDTSRLEPRVAQADAQIAAQGAIVQRLRNGTRPEEIDQARANLRSAEVDADNAGRHYGRLKEISQQSDGGAVSKQDVDNAKAAEAVADARVEVSRKTLELALAGPRKEDIAESEARLRADEAQLDLLRQELADAQLVAPVDAVVRARVMEPGEMASPQKPVLTLAIVDPKWVRAYVTETDLGRVREGMAASVEVDSFPDRRFEAWVGFISPVAEFTPKTVQTNELRTSLVYEIRVFVKDPDNRLRLGMPATVHLTPDEGDLESAPSASAGTAKPAEANAETRP
jgi:HlyD family secretion protein